MGVWVGLPPATPLRAREVWVKAVIGLALGTYLQSYLRSACRAGPAHPVCMPFRDPPSPAVGC